MQSAAFRVRRTPLSCREFSTPGKCGGKLYFYTSLAAYPEIAEVLLDAPEQPLRQPQDRLKRKQAYCGKQQDHTVRNGARCRRFGAANWALTRGSSV